MHCTTVDSADNASEDGDANEDGEGVEDRGEEFEDPEGEPREEDEEAEAEEATKTGREREPIRRLEHVAHSCGRELFVCCFDFCFGIWWSGHSCVVGEPAAGGGGGGLAGGGRVEPRAAREGRVEDGEPHRREHVHAAGAPLRHRLAVHLPSRLPRVRQARLAVARARHHSVLFTWH